VKVGSLVRWVGQVNPEHKDECMTGVIVKIMFDGETDDHPYVADDPCYLVRWFEDNQLTLYLFEDEDIKVVSD